MTALSRLRRHWPLLGPTVTSAVLSSWALGTVGWGNTYYSAAVRSMSQSWHAFWYGALDSVGFVTVDKPPLSLWVQALVVRVFGYSSMSLLVPQVIAGVLTVVLVYAMVVGRWGRIGASVGAMALAVAPISVLVNHSNNTDAILTLAMTATALAGVRAAHTGHWRWVVAAGVLFGASFTTKMLAAAPVLPAVLVAFALAAPVAWRRRGVLLGLGGAVAVATALFWFTAVDLTPASSRPYVGSSSSNSAYQLAFERNGVNQVEGENVMGGTGPGGGIPGGGNRPGGGFGGPGGPGGMQGFSGGEAGALRLWNSDLGTQIGFLVVPGLAGLLAASFAARRRRPWLEPTLVVPAVWFAGGAAAYSITKGIVHPYYVASIVPPLAMLMGAGVGAARHHVDRVRTHAAVGAAVAVSGVASWLIARRVDWSVGTRAAVITVMGGVFLAVFAATTRTRPPRLVSFAVLGLTLLAPAVWTVGSLKAGFNANLPYANPVGDGAFGPGGGRPGGPGGAGFGSSADAGVLGYLRANRGDADWLVATPSAMTAGSLIIETGEPVMALGGFSGNDPILDADGFDAMVEQGRVRFVLLGGGGGPGGSGGLGGAGGPGGPDGLGQHVIETCAAVSDVSASLYDCAR
jgi:4-amino-4-deoxy-L-arabinose transferase-like glycosyltransferase